MKSVFNEGKAAAVQGISHMANPYDMQTEAHDQWAKGWLVGDDPVVFSHLAPTTVTEVDGALVALIAEVMQVDPQETPWEAGRLASQSGCTLEDNPYEPETVDRDEWDRGYVHGSLQSVVSTLEEEGLKLGTPTVEIKPDRSFWAVLNNIQVARQFSVGELAKYIGLDQDRLVAEMVEYGFYDVDGIPLYEVVAA